MRSQAKWLMVLALVLGIGSAGSSPAGAQVYFGASGGNYQPLEEDTSRTEFVGIRGGYRLRKHPDFSLEAAVSGADLGDTFPQGEGEELPEGLKFEYGGLNLDLSLLWYPGHNFVVFGGGGMSRLEAKISGTFLEEELRDYDVSIVFTAHAGAGYEWRIGNHFFVRPEVRYRHFFDDDRVDRQDGFAIIFDASGPEAGVVLGWRLGSGRQPAPGSTPGS